MSLVAYGMSDDESGSDQEEPQTEENERKPIPKSQKVEESEVSIETDNIPISDDEDDQFYSNTAESSRGIHLPAPQNSAPAENVQKSPDLVMESRQAALLAALPKPKTEQPEPEQEDELEDFVKEKTEQLKAAVLREDKPDAAKKRKVIKITAPKLHNSDSDEESKPKAKRTIPAVGGLKKCGLFSVLPAPKNRALGGGKESQQEGQKMFGNLSVKPTPPPQPAAASVVRPTKPAEESPRTQSFKPTSSAPFVPQSLTRKHKPNSMVTFNQETGIMMAARMRKPGVKAAAASDESIAEGGGETEGPSSNTVGKSDESGAKTSAPVRLSGLPMDTGDSSDDEEGTVGSSGSNFFSIGQSGSNPLSASSQTATAVGVRDSEDQPLSFKQTHNVQDAPLQFKSSFRASRTNQPSSSSIGAYDMDSAAYSNAYYNMAGVEGAEMPDEEEEAAGQSLNQDEEFMKIQGRGNRRKEEINFIDVRQDDQIAEVDMNMVKSLSEENSNRQSYSKKKNADMPSSQQKRKHQITYLAFKAKEREVELKDMWASNRQTKRQTQSKYGF